jgi:hypothetical protein
MKKEVCFHNNTATGREIPPKVWLRFPEVVFLLSPVALFFLMSCQEINTPISQKKSANDSIISDTVKQDWFNDTIKYLVNVLIFVFR